MQIEAGIAFIKEINQPKINNMSWFTHPHAIPNPFDFPFSVKHKGITFTLLFVYNEAS